MTDPNYLKFTITKLFADSAGAITSRDMVFRLSIADAGILMRPLVFRASGSAADNIATLDPRAIAGTCPPPSICPPPPAVLPCPKIDCPSITCPEITCPACPIYTAKPIPFYMEPYNLLLVILILVFVLCYQYYTNSSLLDVISDLVK
jgi:hypothetical protein